MRRALFEEGRAVSSEAVLRSVRQALEVPEPTDADWAAVSADLKEGRRRGVLGSPHFFTRDGSFYCPSLSISHDESGYEVHFDQAGFQRFVSAAFSGVTTAQEGVA